MAESVYCSPESITTLLIGYTPIQNVLVLKKFFLIKKERMLQSMKKNHINILNSFCEDWKKSYPSDYFYTGLSDSYICSKKSTYDKNFQLLSGNSW